MPYNPQRNPGAMRQDAMRRSREMQRRAEENSAKQADIPPYISEKSDAPPPSHQTSLLMNELQNLLTGWDSERLALLGLLYFLYKEGADAKLLLAIAYIIL